jgi:hypothetical protein
MKWPEVADKKKRVRLSPEALLIKSARVLEEGLWSLHFLGAQDKARERWSQAGQSLGGEEAPGLPAFSWVQM